MEKFLVEGHESGMNSDWNFNTWAVVVSRLDVRRPLKIKKWTSESINIH